MVLQSSTTVMGAHAHDERDTLQVNVKAQMADSWKNWGLTWEKTPGRRAPLRWRDNCARKTVLLDILFSVWVWPSLILHIFYSQLSSTSRVEFQAWMQDLVIGQPDNEEFGTPSRFPFLSLFPRNSPKTAQIWMPFLGWRSGDWGEEEPGLPCQPKLVRVSLPSHRNVCFFMYLFSFFLPWLAPFGVLNSSSIFLLLFGVPPLLSTW